MDRLTKREIDTLAYAFIQGIGERFSDVPQPGFFHLDYNGFQGGYTFAFTQMDGQVIMPFSAMRLNSRQLATCMKFALAVWGHKITQFQQEESSAA